MFARTDSGLAADRVPMVRARLDITLPEPVWIGHLSTQLPELTFRVLAAVPRGDHGVGLVEILGDGARSAPERIGEASDVRSVDVLASSGERALVQFETEEALLLFSAQESGVPLEPPIEIRDGVARVEVTAPRERLSELGQQLDVFGMSYDVAYIRQTVEPESLLTDRQAEFVRTAVEEGYYATPRRTTLTDLADELDVAKSTLSETLHRAEGAIIREWIDAPQVGAEAP
jgi:hypothetical protein